MLDAQLALDPMKELQKLLGSPRRKLSLPQPLNTGIIDLPAALPQLHTTDLHLLSGPPSISQGPVPSPRSHCTTPTPSRHQGASATSPRSFWGPLLPLAPPQSVWGTMPGSNLPESARNRPRTGTGPNCSMTKLRGNFEMEQLRHNEILCGMQLSRIGGGCIAKEWRPEKAVIPQRHPPKTSYTNMSHARSLQTHRGTSDSKSSLKNVNPMFQQQRKIQQVPLTDRPMQRLRWGASSKGRLERGNTHNPMIEVPLFPVCNVVPAVVDSAPLRALMVGMEAARSQRSLTVPTENTR